MYIYIYVYIYIYIYVSADLSRASSVLDSTSLPTTSSPFPTSLPSKQCPEEDINPASPSGQAAEIKESYPPGSQAAGIQDLGARMLKSRHLIILSASIGDLLGRHSLPQGAKPSGPESHSPPQGAKVEYSAAAVRQGSGPRIQQISINRCIQASKHPFLRS